MVVLFKLIFNKNAKKFNGKLDKLYVQHVCLTKQNQNLPELGHKPKWHQNEAKDAFVLLKNRGLYWTTFFVPYLIYKLVMGLDKGS